MLIIFANFHSLRLPSSFSNTASPIQNFLLETNHFCLSSKVARNFLRHLFQNSLHICYTLLQRLLQYKSGFPNAPAVGITTFDFILWRWLGESATSLLTSLMVSTTSGLELTMASTSVNRVFNDSSSKLLLWVLDNDAKIFLADLICLSHIPPMWLAMGGFLFQTIQSVFWLSMKCFIFLWSISLKDFANSLSAPTKLFPLSQLMDLTLPLLTMKRLRVRMKESVSIVFVISIWTARLTKHVKSTP